MVKEGDMLSLSESDPIDRFPDIEDDLASEGRSVDSGLIDAYQAVFNSNNGRRVLLDIMSSANMFKGHKNMSLLQFDEGKRQLCLYILSKIYNRRDKDVSRFVMDMINNLSMR